MSQESTLTGLVLRRWDSGEADRRLSVLTREQGKVTLVAKGARKSGARLASVSEPLALATFHLAAGKRTGYITQAQVQRGFAGLRTDYTRLSLGLAFAELISAIAPPDRPDDDLFETALVGLKWIEMHEKPLVASVWGQLQLMSAEGILPAWTTCAADGTVLTENPAWISPTAGGYVSALAAQQYVDRRLSRAEVLIGLDKTSVLDQPPPRLKFVEEAAGLLYEFWQHHAGRDIPANESVLQYLKTIRESGESPAS